MPRVVKGRRCALVADLVVALVIVAGGIAIGALLGVEVADWHARHVAQQPAG